VVPSSPTVCYDALDPPVGGIFVLEISLMPLSQKPVQKRFLPQKGVPFLTEDVFAKKFSGAGEDSAVGGCVRCCHALGGLRLRPWTGVTQEPGCAAVRPEARWRHSPRAGGAGEKAAHLPAPPGRRQGHDAGGPKAPSHAISDEMRAVVEELWPELAHKLPPKVPQ